MFVLSLTQNQKVLGMAILLRFWFQFFGSRASPTQVSQITSQALHNCYLQEIM